MWVPVVGHVIRELQAILLHLGHQARCHFILVHEETRKEHRIETMVTPGSPEISPGAPGNSGKKRKAEKT